MVELIKMTDQELAIRIINYVERIEILMDDISEILKGKNTNKISKIKDEYKKLKQEIKEDAHYLDLERNQSLKGNVYDAVFMPSVVEAAAWGFISPINSNIDFKLYHTLEEAEYKLTKYYTLEEWKKVALGESL